jgi:hypothetical protein
MGTEPVLAGERLIVFRGFRRGIGILPMFFVGQRSATPFASTQLKPKHARGVRFIG